MQMVQVLENIKDKGYQCSGNDLHDLSKLSHRIMSDGPVNAEAETNRFESIDKREFQKEHWNPDRMHKLLRKRSRALSHSQNVSQNLFHLMVTELGKL